MSKATLETANSGDTEVQQAVRDGARVHNVCRNDEQWHSEQDCAAIETLQNFLSRKRDI